MSEANAQSNTVRIPPQSLEAEKSVLGSIMLDSDIIHDVADFLTGDDFYHEKTAECEATL